MGVEGFLPQHTSRKESHPIIFPSHLFYERAVFFPINPPFPPKSDGRAGIQECIVPHYQEVCFLSAPPTSSYHGPHDTSPYTSPPIFGDVDMSIWEDPRFLSTFHSSDGLPQAHQQSWMREGLRSLGLLLECLTSHPLLVSPSLVLSSVFTTWGG